MACSLPHTDSEVEALIQKLIDEDKGRRNAILDLALQFKNSCTAKDDLRNAYEKCTDISQESRALIDTFLKEGSDKDYDLNLSMYGKTEKLEKQMDAKLAWQLEKYYCRSQTNMGDVYFTAKKLHQLHLDEEALKETLEEQAIDEKAREENIRQKQADDDEFLLEFEVSCKVSFIWREKVDMALTCQVGFSPPYHPALYHTTSYPTIQMDSNFTNENDPWGYSLDKDDSDLHLTHVLRSSSSARVEPSSSTPNSVRIIPRPAGTQAKQLKEKVFILYPDGALMSTQKYMQKVVEDVDEEDDFNSGAWISTTNYVISTGGTVTGYSYKVLDVGNYGNDIIVGAVMILANVSVFTPKTSERYLNIIKKNVVKVFRSDTVLLA
nr:hypothetical protein [Tanacetum cinerariifolium]